MAWKCIADESSALKLRDFYGLLGVLLIFRHFIAEPSFQTSSTVAFNITPVYGPPFRSECYGRDFSEDYT
jgi:hypothetical protein